jgi:hypothetical protein
MKIQKDYEEFLGLLNEHGVRYCIIGSFALALHARPRYTKDMDILIRPTRDNAKAALKALQDFGFESPELTEEDFLDPEKVIQIGYEPVRIDLLTSIPGCTFDDAWEGRVAARYGSIDAFFIGRQALIESKRASGRKQDLADLELLEESS